jgi:hypothetical protein
MIVLTNLLTKSQELERISNKKATYTHKASNSFLATNSACSASKNESSTYSIPPKFARSFPATRFDGSKYYI